MATLPAPLPIEMSIRAQWYMESVFCLHSGIFAGCTANSPYWQSLASGLSSALFASVAAALLCAQLPDPAIAVSTQTLTRANNKFCNLQSPLAGLQIRKKQPPHLLLPSFLLAVEIATLLEKWERLIYRTMPIKKVAACSPILRMSVKWHPFLKIFLLCQLYRSFQYRRCSPGDDWQLKIEAYWSSCWGGDDVSSRPTIAFVCSFTALNNIRTERIMLWAWHGQLPASHFWQCCLKA